MKDSATILAIETATSLCSVALCCNAGCFERSEQGNNVHSQVLLDFVDDLLKQGGIKLTDVDAIAVGQGPGSFTGLRIGIGVAQGLSYAADIPMIGVSSLQTLAQLSPQSGLVLAGIDARMGQIYWGLFDKQGDNAKLLNPLQVSSPEDITLQGVKLKDISDFNIALVGNAWAEYHAELNSDLLGRSQHFESILFPQAATQLILAQLAYQQQSLVSAVDFLADYVRNDVAAKSTKKPF